VGATTTSRYRPDAPPDYSHRFHAGNVGDVWKHCALVEVLRSIAAAAARVAYLDTHAGEGRYPLGPTGEWTEGIGRLWDADPGDDDPLGRYVALCRRLGGGTGRPVEYPGSPAFARAVLGQTATLDLWECDPAASERLRRHVGDDPHVRLAGEDGLAALDGALRAAERRTGDAVVVLVDPPYGRKADWIAVPDALARAVVASTRAAFVLWYPVKSLTRPNAMIARLATAGVAGTIVEVVTTPLDERRNRLNGSGVLLVRPPSGTIDSLAAVAATIGARCATLPQRWSVRVQAWPGRHG
jgi:23S rRNA (adenine2030-N6)-methyltransferase